MRTRNALLATAATCIWLWGCPARQEYREFTPQDDVTNVSPHDHHHAHGPHDGHLIELGDEAYHAELVMDSATRNVTVYLLGSDAATPHPVAEASLTLRLEGAEPLTFTATPQDGDPEGQSSRFELAGDALPAAVKTEEDLHGEIALSVGGETFSGAISHDHDHGHAH